MALTRAPSPIVELVPLSRLTPAAWNPRLIRDERFRSLVRSIEEDPEFMRNRPILATADGTIYAGNMRYRAAATAGWTEVPAIIEDIPEAQAKARAVRDNNGWGEWQDEELTELLHDIGNLGGSLDDLGFDRAALSNMLGLDEPVDGLTDPDDLPPLTTPSVHRGELWQLGDHRLLIGDSTDATDVARLIEGEVDLLWTDPPYGVEYVGKTEEKLTIENDGISPADTQTLVSSACRLTPLRKGGSFYITAPSGPQLFDFMQALRDSGLRLRQTLMWVKDRFVLGRSDFHYRHEAVLHGDVAEKDYEPIMYGWAEGEAHVFYGGRRLDTVWEIPRPSASREHPTMKPVELVTRAFEYSTQRGERVYDPFAGSGTTVIAAEQLGRLCLAMELDPRYAQVIIDRWENFTGQKATRVEAADAAA